MDVLCVQSPRRKMIMKPLLVLLLCFASFAVQSAPPCEKCDMEIVETTRDSLSSLNFERVENFLCTFDKSCAGDFEFYRASNETLFDLIYHVPELFLKVLQYGNLKNHEVIMDELGTPASAGIDVEVIRMKIKKQDEKYMYKHDVLSALH